MQSVLSDLLRIPYPKIPPEVMDAFVHDPAAVTGATRRVKGWEAVEDIHVRIQRQRETLQSFLHAHDIGCDPAECTGNVFDDQIATAMRALEQLGSQREALAQKAEEVTSLLKRVKAVHATVKKDYNDTLAHTSLVYPEVGCSLMWCVG